MLFRSGDLSSVWLVGNVREQDAPLVRLWAPIIVEPLVMPGRHFRARLTYVAPAIDPQTRRLTVRAELANPDGILRPEMFATFWVTTGPSVSSPAVPEESVIYEGDEARVWVVGDNRQISLRRIEPGRSEQGYIEVVHGLREGERVVTSGALFIDRAVKRAPAARRAA